MEKFVCSTAEFSQNIETLIQDGATVPLCVTGNSMNPFLVHGRDVVYLRKCEEKDIKRGSILLFRRADSSLVLHRLIGISKDGLLLMNGDAQVWCEKTDRNHVVAVAFATERDGKMRLSNSLSIRVRDYIWRLTKPLRPLIMRLWRKIKRISEKR